MLAKKNKLIRQAKTLSAHPQYISNGSILSPRVDKSGLCSTERKDLHRLPGYGSGFVKAEALSEVVAVLAPLLKILGPHLGRDPIMFARVS